MQRKNLRRPFGSGPADLNPIQRRRYLQRDFAEWTSSVILDGDAATHVQRILQWQQVHIKIERSDQDSGPLLIRRSDIIRLLLRLRGRRWLQVAAPRIN